MASMNGLGLNGPHGASTLTTASGESLVGIGSKDDLLKCQLTTREGVYRSMAANEFRPNRLGYTASPATNTPVKVSFVSMRDSVGLPIDRICFNVGRELFVYNYRGVKKPTDHSKPVDKRIYKGTFPTCHDFNEASVTTDGVNLLIGFSAGQIQLIDPIKKDSNKLFNEERLIDKTKVTCIKWVPKSLNVFLVSHSSGHLYVYKEDLQCGQTPPHYQLFKSGDGFSVYTCRAKSTRNPMYRWTIGEGSLNEFAFSPCGRFLATVSQDGFLRIFEYDTMELTSRMRSYFGGLLCLSWSPDGKYIVTGGEDDLITVWSVYQKRVIARGQGHKSWVSVVAFDPFTTSIADHCDVVNGDHNASDDDVASPSSPSASIPSNGSDRGKGTFSAFSASNRNSTSCQSPSGRETPAVTSYRIGSVGQDTNLCLWELSDDVLKQPVGRSRTSILVHSPSVHVPSNIIASSTATNPVSSNGPSDATSHPIPNNHVKSGSLSGGVPSDGHSVSSTTSAHSVPLSSNKDVSSTKKEHKRSFSLVGTRNSDKNNVSRVNQKTSEDPVKLLGSPCCPRLVDVPMLEPLVCKKISHERLTSLVFREDCFVTACQEGFVSTWARPGHGTNAQLLCSPSALSDDESDHMDVEGDTIV